MLSSIDMVYSFKLFGPQKKKKRLILYFFNAVWKKKKLNWESKCKETN